MAEKGYFSEIAFQQTNHLKALLLIGSVRLKKHGDVESDHVFYFLEIHLFNGQVAQKLVEALDIHEQYQKYACHRDQGVQQAIFRLARV